MCNTREPSAGMSNIVILALGETEGCRSGGSLAANKRRREDQYLCIEIQPSFIIMHLQILVSPPALRRE